MNGIVNGKSTKSLSDITPATFDSAKTFIVPYDTWTDIPDCAFILTGAVYGWWWNLLFVNAGYALEGGSQFTGYVKPYFSLPVYNIVWMYHYSTSTGSNTLSYNVATKQIYWNWSELNSQGQQVASQTFYYW